MQVAITPTEIGVSIPQVTVEKTAITGVGGDHLVHRGGEITYIIAVTNNGENEVKNIEITDKIPEKTTFKSIQDAVIINEIEGGLESKEIGTKTTLKNKQNEIAGVKWIVTIPAHGTVIAEFTVTVDEKMLNENNEEVETTGIIYNKAIANGEESNETQTAIIGIDVVKEISKIKRVENGVETYIDLEDDNLAVKVGDIIEYTITVTNTGSRDLKNVLLEEQLVDIEIETLSIDGKQIASKKDGTLEYKLDVDGKEKLVIGYLNAAKDAVEATETTEAQPAVKAGVATITATYRVSYDNKIEESITLTHIHNKVYGTGETVPEPKNPNEVSEKVEDNDDEIVPVEQYPKIKVEKTAQRVKKLGEKTYIPISEKVRVGDVVEYEITVKNIGNTKLTNIILTDTLNVRVGNDEKNLIPKGEVIGKILSLESGDWATIMTYYTIDESDITEAEIVKNVVTATADGDIKDDDDADVPVNPNLTITITKSWNDNDDEYGLRTDTVTVDIIGTVNGKEVKRYNDILIEKDNGWKNQISGFPKYEGNDEIVYTVVETKVGDKAVGIDYTSSPQVIDTKTKAATVTITNTLIEKTIDRTITKIWDDNSGNYETISDEDISINLYYYTNDINNKTLVDTQTNSKIKIEKSKTENKWIYTYKNLPQYINKQPVTYIAKEDIVPNGYIPSYSDDQLTIKNTYVTKIKTSKKDKQIVFSEDIIEYVITVTNHGTTPVAKYEVQDKDLLDLLDEKKVVMLDYNDEVPVDAKTECIEVTSSKLSTPSYITAEAIGKENYFIDLDGNEVKTIKIKVKVTDSLPGDDIKNSLVGEKTVIENYVEAKSDVIKIVPNTQEAIVIIDLSLSMAQAVETPESQINLKDPMAYKYEDTRWYALRMALDSFINSFMMDSEGKPNGNTITIIGYNDNVVLNQTATTAEEAIEIYEDVFKPEHFRTLQEAVFAEDFDVKAWNDLKDAENKDMYGTKIDENAEPNKREIDVDGLRNTTIFKGMEMTKLAPRTNIEAGLLKANEIIKNKELDNEHVILMTDGEANRAVTSINEGNYITGVPSIPNAEDLTKEEKEAKIQEKIQEQIKDVARSITNPDGQSNTDDGAKLYTIALSLNSEKTQILNTIASSTGSEEIGTNGKFFYSASDMKHLIQYFDTISKTITSGKQTGTITDDGKLILTEAIQIDANAVKSIIVQVKDKEILKETKWLDFEKNYCIIESTVDETGDTIKIRKIDIRKIIDTYNNSVENTTDKVNAITDNIQIIIQQGVAR